MKHPWRLILTDPVQRLLHRYMNLGYEEQHALIHGLVSDGQWITAMRLLQRLINIGHPEECRNLYQELTQALLTRKMIPEARKVIRLGQSSDHRVWGYLEIYRVTRNSNDLRSARRIADYFEFRLVVQYMDLYLAIARVSGQRTDIERIKAKFPSLRPMSRCEVQIQIANTTLCPEDFADAVRICIECAQMKMLSELLAGLRQRGNRALIARVALLLRLDEVRDRVRHLRDTLPTSKPRRHRPRF